ncbi:MAG: DUF4143 domain-containing protein [gamma proteobacterium symbiont of Taylorina sp.]|nr:DUF4143 domain-containing protein [gamma proteobacterium symbiont of Taylorina sp.]
MDNSNKTKKPETLLVDELYQRIWRGSYPRVINEKKISIDLFYNSYLQTYIQRDVRELTQVADEKKFRDFIRAAAARTSQLLNYSNLAHDIFNENYGEKWPKSGFLW